MRAISIWQPWASAIALDLKRFETRHWEAPPSAIGKRIAIHAAKRPMGWFETSLARVYGMPAEIPLGAVVAVARLVRCHRVEAVRDEITLQELTLGNYEPGRFAWELAEVQLLDPIPYKGQQGIFRLDAVASRMVLDQLKETA